MELFKLSILILVLLLLFAGFIHIAYYIISNLWFIRFTIPKLRIEYETYGYVIFEKEYCEVTPGGYLCKLEDDVVQPILLHEKLEKILKQKSAKKKKKI